MVSTVVGAGGGMKFGYSILLGEHVEAEEVAYKDCEVFQVVCPACMEPVFKGERDLGEDAKTHYLSHYRADKSLASDCELRVGSLVKADLERSNTASREQKLKLFLSVLQGAVIRTHWGAENRNRLRKVIRDMQSAKHLAALRDVASQPKYTQHMLESFDLNAESYYEDAGRPETTYSERVQRRIARDMLSHIGSPNGRASFDFLFNASMLFLLRRLEKAVEVGVADGQSQRLHAYVERLVAANTKRGFAVVQEMMQDMAYPPFVEEPMPFLSKAVAQVGHEMIGALLRLPYFEMLKESAFRPKH